MADTLSPTMTVREFENGYWYVAELRDFGGRIGIPGAARLRKDELERAIVAFLHTGAVKLPTKRALRKTGMKDLERGLTLNLRIEHYYINFVAEFLAAEKRTRANAIAAWTGLKAMDIPKSYAEWAKARAKRRETAR
jgi:hypothetical protein